MDRPYLALAALLATLTGTALAVGPARCQKSAHIDIRPSLAFCSCDIDASAEDVFNMAGQDAGLNEEYFSSDNTQGCDLAAEEYQGSCGHDPLRGDVYDVEPMTAGNIEPDHEFARLVEHWNETVDYWSLFESEISTEVAAQTEEPAQSIKVCMPTYYEEDEAFVIEANVSPIDDSAANSEHDCLDAYRQWKSEMELRDSVASAIEAYAPPAMEWMATQVRELNASWQRFDASAERNFAKSDWRVSPPEACPAFTDDYFGPSIEDQYAQAELAAAHAARAAIENQVSDTPSTEAPLNYGPESPVEVAYDEEYQSQFELARIEADVLEANIVDNEAIDEQAIIEARDERFTSEDVEVAAEEDFDWSPNEPAAQKKNFRGLIEKVQGVYRQIVPVIDNGNDEWFKSVIWLWNQIPEAPLAMANDPYADYAEITEQDARLLHDLVEARDDRSAETSTDWAAEIASGLRFTGKFLLQQADRLAPAENLSSVE